MITLFQPPIMQVNVLLWPVAQPHPCLDVVTYPLLLPPTLWFRSSQMSSILFTVIAKRSDQSLVVTSATNQSTLSRLLYIAEQNGGYCFLVDTGAEVSLIPASTLERKHQQVGFSLQAANGSSIPTYGTLSLQLQHSLPWIFIIADVQNYPILGVDFLKSFHLLVDIKGKRLFNTITSVHVQGVGSHEATLSSVWEVLSPQTPFTSILKIYLSVTCPPSSDKPVQHLITDLITTKGQPVCACLCRLPPDRLKITPQGFDDMLQIGIIHPSSSNWSSPLHMVPKRTPDDWHPCGDFRALNSVAAQDWYPIPHLHKLSKSLHGSTIFSTWFKLIARYQLLQKMYQKLPSPLL